MLTRSTCLLSPLLFVAGLRAGGDESLDEFRRLISKPIAELQESLFAELGLSAGSQQGVLQSAALVEVRPLINEAMGSLQRTLLERFKSSVHKPLEDSKKALLVVLKSLVSEPRAELQLEYEQLAHQPVQQLREAFQERSRMPAQDKLSAELGVLAPDLARGVRRKIEILWRKPASALREGLAELPLDPALRDGLEPLLQEREFCDDAEQLLRRQAMLKCVGDFTRRDERDVRCDLRRVLGQREKALREPEQKARMLLLLKALPQWSQQDRRVFEERLLSHRRPSDVIRDMQLMGSFLEKMLPEVAGLIGLAHDTQWHPEGDVFNHTMLVLDAAAEELCDNPRERLILLYAAIAHDLGKKVTTTFFPDPDRKYLDNGKINWRVGSRFHAVESEVIARLMMERIGVDPQMIEAVAKLARWHMEHGPLGQEKPRFKEEIIERMCGELREDIAGKVAFTTLLKLMRADMRGSGTTNGLPRPEREFDLIERYKGVARDYGLLQDGEGLCDAVSDVGSDADPTYVSRRRRKRALSCERKQDDATTNAADSQQDGAESLFDAESDDEPAPRAKRRRKRAVSPEVAGDEDGTNVIASLHEEAEQDGAPVLGAKRHRRLRRMADGNA